MERRGVIGWVLLAAVILIAAASLYGMMRKRFATGTAYPPLSTLRADPLGARAIFEALDRLPGVRSARNFRQLKHLEGAPGKTLFVLNVSQDAFEIRSILEGDPIARFAADGGRVIITVDAHSRRTLSRSFERAVKSIKEEVDEEESEGDDAEAAAENPVQNKGKAKKKKKDRPRLIPAEEIGEEKKETKEKSTSNKNEDEDEDEDHVNRHRPSLEQALKLRIDARDFKLSAKGGAKLRVPASSPLSVIPLPEWFSDTTLIPHNGDDDASLDSPNAEWQPLAFRSDRAMIAQRRIGTGSIVVCSDSYFMTNEALWAAPSSEFLLWLIGGAKELVFDERHLGLGLGDDPGIMNLARRYHMHGMFIGGILLFGLFVWRNSSSLIPHNEAVDLGITKGGLVSGEGASAGLISMLRRGLPRSALLVKCFNSWIATPAAVQRTPTKRIDAAKQALESAMADPTQRKNIPGLYEQLSQTLHAPNSTASKPPNS